MMGGRGAIGETRVAQGDQKGGTMADPAKVRGYEALAPNEIHHRDGFGCCTIASRYKDP